MYTGTQPHDNTQCPRGCACLAAPSRYFGCPLVSTTSTTSTTFKHFWSALLMLASFHVPIARLRVEAPLTIRALLETRIRWGWCWRRHVCTPLTTLLWITVVTCCLHCSLQCIAFSFPLWHSSAHRLILAFLSCSFAALGHSLRSRNGTCCHFGFFVLLSFDSLADCLMLGKLLHKETPLTDSALAH